MIVMKFGGSSIGSVESISTAATVVSESIKAQPVVILSAIAGVTDRLIATGDIALRGLGASVNENVSALREMHELAVSALLPVSDLRTAVNAQLAPIWEEIENVFTGVLLLRECSPAPGI